MRRAMTCALAAAALMSAVVAPSVGAATAKPTTYVVVYKEGATLQQGRAAVKAAGGTVLKETKAIGVASVTSSNPRFIADVAAQRALVGAARNEPIGFAPGAHPKRYDVEKETGGLTGATAGATARNGAAAAAIAGDPLSPLQWDMRMIPATPEGSYAVQQGSHDVLVGVMDTGIDGSHPDIAANF